MRMNYVRNVRRTVETYDIDLRVLLEMVQNSIDAIRQNPNVDRGQIVVDIDVPSGSVTVTDNGVGFPRKPDLLFLGGTDKSEDPQQLGKIGVGLKAVIFSTSCFSIESVTKSHGFQFAVSGAAAALEHAGSNPELALHPERDNHIAYGGEGLVTRTTIKAQFDSALLVQWLDSVYHSVFEVEELRAGEANAAQVLYQYGSPFKSKAEAMLALYLQTAPYIGDVEQLLRQTKLPIDLALKLEVGSEPNVTFQGYDHLAALFEKENEVQVSVECQYPDFEALLSQIPSRRQPWTIYAHPIPPGGGNVGESLRNYIWVNRLTSEREIEDLIKDRNNRIHWDQFERFRSKIKGIYLVLGAPEILRRFIPGGASRIMSARGIITAHSFVTPRGARHELYVPRIHMVLDVDEDLNYGKRHLNNQWSVKRANDYFGEAYIRTLFNATSRLSARAKRTKPDDRTYVGAPILSIETTLFKEPAVEQDVIGLFFDLAGRGAVGGYRIYGLSQVETYDGRFLAEMPGQRSWPTPTSDDRLYTLEFKYLLSGLLKDIEEESKSAEDIDLAIVWGIGEAEVPDRFKLVHPDVSEAGMDNKLFPHVNAVLIDSVDNSEVQILELREFVQGLSDDG